MNQYQLKGKRYLRRMSLLPELIDEKKLEVDRLRTLAAGMDAIRYDKDRVQSSPRDSMPEAVIRLVEYCEKADKALSESIEEYDAGMEILDTLDEEEQSVITHHFFQHKTFRQISNITPMSESTILRKYMSGLENFGRNLTEVDSK